MIPVTKSFIPPIETYIEYVQRAFSNGWLTNRGPLVLELEDKLKKHLGLKNVLLTNNGTVPLQIALKLLANGGEVITTPFSYVATTAAIVWENCTPVFVDIHPEYLTIDETKIEAAITENTTCILATHVFGNPCNVEEIERIAKKHNLKVIYDAAHCFGVEYKGKSIFEYGDVSTCSFHATKLFHTGEGGSIFCNDPELFDRIYYSHNFGHKGPYEICQLGINAKMSELQAAMGLAVFQNLKEIMQSRFTSVEHYRLQLKTNLISHVRIRDHSKWNNSYFPVIMNESIHMKEFIEHLESNDIFCRRYFYPSLCNLSYLDKVSHDVTLLSKSISKRILCLPLYAFMEKNELNKVTSTINNYLNTQV